MDSGIAGRQARRLAASALVLALGLAACNRPPPRPVVPPRYVVGQGYQLGGFWSYPRENFALVETGLAAVIPDSRPGRNTANGEIYDPTALVGAHRTLQLPVVLRVTNLENGLELLVRVNDRGPAQPGRVIGLSQRAATLLEIRPAGGTQIRIAVEEAPSRALAGSMPQPEAVPLPVATAPSGSVQRETLAPTPGAREAGSVRQGRSLGPAVVAAPEAGAGLAAVPLRLPEQLQRVGVAPGRLWIQAGTFTARDPAQRQAARLAGARVEAFGPARRPEYRVRLGPYFAVDQADRALEQVMRSGVSEAQILVD